MPSYKLIYFNVRGRAEVTRLLFAQAGVVYEDMRIQHEKWPALKPTVPTRTLPVLEIDGKVFPQSNAIARYVARECDLAGSNNLEMFQCEAVMDTIADIQSDLVPWFKEKDESKKAELKKKIFAESVKPKLKLVEDMLIANGGEVFVGKTITMADICFFAASEGLQMLSEEPLRDFPKLTALKAKVGKEPRIAAWVAKRPVTQM